MWNSRPLPSLASAARSLPSRASCRSTAAASSIRPGGWGGGGRGGKQQRGRPPRRFLAPAKEGEQRRFPPGILSRHESLPTGLSVSSSDTLEKCWSFTRQVLLRILADIRTRARAARSRRAAFRVVAIAACRAGTGRQSPSPLVQLRRQVIEPLGRAEFHAVCRATGPGHEA
jgi:hypothetical protein